MVIGGIDRDPRPKPYENLKQYIDRVIVGVVEYEHNFAEIPISSIRFADIAFVFVPASTERIKK